MVTRSTRGWSGQRTSSACRMRAIVLLPTATLPASPDDVRHARVQLAEERLGHDVQLTGRREPQVQQPRQRQVDVFDLLERHGLVAGRAAPRGRLRSSVSGVDARAARLHCLRGEVDVRAISGGRPRRPPRSATPDSMCCYSPSDTDRAAHAGAAEAAVTHRVLRQVLLVVVLGVVERRRVEDLGRDRRRSPASSSRSWNISRDCLGRLRAARRRTRRCRSGTACRRRCPGACPASGRGSPRTPAGASRRRHLPGSNTTSTASV